MSLAQTEDFRTFERLGMVMSPEDKNAALLPRRIDGDWVLFHRPTSVHGADVWLSRSSDLKSWRSPELVLEPPRRAAGGTRPASAWDRRRSRPSTAGSSSTTACARRSPGGSTAPASRSSTSTTRPGSCGARRNGCSARGARLRGLGRRAERRVPVRPRASPRHRRAATCTTAPPTRASASRRRSCADVLDYLLACPPG